MENGFSHEVDRTEESPWYKAMKVFNDIYGVGPVTSQAWYSEGLRDLQDVINTEHLQKREDQRVLMGRVFSFHLKCVEAIVDYILTSSQKKKKKKRKEKNK